MLGRRRLATALVALALAALGSALLWPQEGPRRGWRAAVSSTVEVLASGCGPREQHGSGAAVGDEQVITVAHIVAGSRTLAVRDLGGRRRPAWLLALDLERDLALLEVEGLEVPALPRGEADAGEEGRVLSYATSSLEPRPFRLVRRVRARMTDLYGTHMVERDVLEIVATIDPGDSGAALVDSSGSLVGIVFAASREREGSGYAVAASEIESLVSAAATGSARPGRCP
jgi:S1-C subfamily serine protease